MLDEFRTIDIKWNNAYERLGDVRTAQFDERGRKLVVQVTDGGDIVDLSGVELKLVTVDGLEVGGRNYIRNSHFDELDNFNGFIPLYGYGEIKDSKYIHTLTSTGATRIEKQLELNEVGTFTYSIYAKVSTAIEWQRHVDIEAERKRQPSQDGYAVYSFTFTNHEPGIKRIRGYFGNAIGDYIEIEWEKLEKGTKATDWTPAPEDLRFSFDLVDPSRGIYELYFPKLFVDRYSGNTKVFLELATSEFSITSEPFYINVFDGVR